MFMRGEKEERQFEYLDIQQTFLKSLCFLDFLQ